MLKLLEIRGLIRRPDEPPLQTIPSSVKLGEEVQCIRPMQVHPPVDCWFVQLGGHYPVSCAAPITLEVLSGAQPTVKLGLLNPIACAVDGHKRLPRVKPNLI